MAFLPKRHTVHTKPPAVARRRFTAILYAAKQVGLQVEPAEPFVNVDRAEPFDEPPVVPKLYDFLCPSVYCAVVAKIKTVVGCIVESKQENLSVFLARSTE